MSIETIYQPEYTNSWAFLIGINAYHKVSSLEYACNDANVFARILRDKFGFPESNIKLLTDDHATRQGISEAFFCYTNDQVSPDDRLIVFFAGHGFTKSGQRGDVGFLVPVDGTPNELSTLIRWDEFTKNSELIPAKHILFIMDACFGGLALKRSISPGTMRFAKDMLQRYSRQVLTAGKANEVVADSGGPRSGHSIFTGHLLNLLEKSSLDVSKPITANEVMAYVYDRVSKDNYSHQTPHYGYFDGDGDFIFNVSFLEALSSNSEIDKDVMVEIPPTLIYQPVPNEMKTLEDTVKSYLSDTGDRIRLDDLVTKEIRRFLYSMAEKDSAAQAINPTHQEFANSLKQYEHIISNLQNLVTLIAKWGTDLHWGTLEKIFSRTSEFDNSGEGITSSFPLRWYPIMLLLYSGGIAALSNSNYENLTAMFKAPVRSRHSGSPTHEVIILTVEEILKIQRVNLFKSIPGHERNYVPISEYLFKVLQPPLDDLLFLGRSYEFLFDKFEVFFALVYADLTYERFGSSRIWGPPGRFGWKYYTRIDSDNPFKQLVTEAAHQQNDWGPIKAGLFRNSYERFKLIAENYEEFIKGLHWF